MNKIAVYLKFLISGLAFGIANVIPGVSGGTMLVVFGIYDKLTEAISGPKAIFKNFGFLLCFGLGAISGILGFAFVITYLFENFGVQTNMFFIGLILGSVPLVIRTATEKDKIKPLCAIPFIIGLVAVVGLTMLEGTGSAEPYSIVSSSTCEDEIFYHGKITITNNSDRTIDSWSIELTGDTHFDPIAKDAEGAVIEMHKSTMDTIKKLFGADIPDVFNTIRSEEGVQIAPHSEYTFTYMNYGSEINISDMELSVSYSMDVLFFFTMLVALFIAAVAMIIPGVSGSFVMMLLGVYSTVIAAIKDINLLIIIPCAVGALLGIILGARLVSGLIKRHGLMMYSAIMGLVIGSIYAILPSGFGFNLQTGYGFVALFGGILLSLLIDKIGKTDKKENTVNDSK